MEGQVDFEEVEAKCLEKGKKEYGLTGTVLLEFVETRLKDAREREQRHEARQAKKEEEQRKHQYDLEIQQLRGKLPAKEEREQPTKLPVPKFEDKTDVAKYLDLFEGVVKQNGFKEEVWPLALRTAVVGSKLEAVVETGGTYAELKRELLTTFGQSPEKAFKSLLAVKQGEESFRQYLVQVQRELARFMELACVKDQASLEAAITKYLVWDSCTVNLKTFLVERKLSSLTMEDFTELGVAYQEAHGRSRSKAAAGGTALPAELASAQVFKMTVEGDDRRAKLTKMSVKERYRFVVDNRLCFNCMKPGHRSNACMSQRKCDVCQRKHHTLLHEEREEPVRRANVATFSNTTYPSDSHLMTAVVVTKAECRARVRAFFDQGSQASFVSTALADAISAPTCGTARITLQGFGGPPTETETAIRSLKLISENGREWEIKALERPTLELGINRVPLEAVQRWKLRGVQLSDTERADVQPEIHLLIGADYANKFLHDKQEDGEEVAWRTEFGWVLSGQHNTPAKNVKVALVQTKLQALWELEEPAATARVPAFPLTKDGNEYEVGLLWKGTQRPEDNRQHAEALACSLRKRLRNKDQYDQYTSVLIKEYQELEAIELEPQPEQPGYFLPHHAVIREESTTTKVRVVFNASSARKGCHSLNDVVDPGPSLLPDLVSLLLRFREFEYALQADIRKAFFMVGVHERDRPYVRFWWPDITGRMRVWRLRKLPFGVNCSPFLLTAVLQHHLQEQIARAEPEQKSIMQQLSKSFYVDDSVSSVSSKKQAEQFKAINTSVLSEANMELRKWRCSGDAGEKAEGKVLGVRWNSERDDLSPCVPAEAAQSRAWTRRSLLQCVASVFDPLGLIAPFVLTGKICLQESCKAETEWDDPISEELGRKVSQWWSMAPQLVHVRMPRWSGIRPTEPFQLHLFCDASEKGYGVGVYAVTASHSRLIYAKTKVAPLKSQTLARLEMQAAFVGASCARVVLSSLNSKPAAVHAWTDSMTTYYWIKGQPHRWKTWVANRVAAVQQTSEELGILWHHCPGLQNPADLASRGATPEQLQDDFWQAGPAWLLKEEAWPTRADVKPTDEAVKEVKICAVVVKQPEIDAWWLRLSRWTRVQGVVIRLLSWRYRQADQAELLAKADIVLYRTMQQQVFPEERAALAAGKEVPKSSKVRKFGPFLDKDGLMRADGRLQNADLEYGCKHPILLERHHLLTLLMRHVHQKHLHVGVEAMLAMVRKQFWVIGGRRILRNLKQTCTTCRRYDAAPASEIAAPLPKDRVVHSHPFAMCGVDYAGPLFVRDGGRPTKVWVALFVCGTTRAVHLEMARSCSGDDFMLVFRRFVARRGRPTLIRSDNGGNFTAAAKMIPIKWIFNPPASPWHGGFFERLVQTIKKPLRKVLGKALLKSDEFETLLVEVEALVNQRPLTHVGELDEPTPLTPEMLMGHVWRSEEGEAAATADDLCKRAEHIQMVLDHLKRRWMDEYLLQLRNFRGVEGKPVAPDDFVLVVESDKRRQLWQLGRVLEVYRGRDGKCRVADVRVKGTVLTRPVQRLIPLELSGHDGADKPNDAPPADDAAPETEMAAPLTEDSVVRSQSPRRKGTVPEQQTRTRVVRPAPRLDL